MKERSHLAPVKTYLIKLTDQFLFLLKKEFYDEKTITT
jgi:hypothetical protein